MAAETMHGRGSVWIDLDVEKVPTSAVTKAKAILR